MFFLSLSVWTKTMLPGFYFHIEFLTLYRNISRIYMATLQKLVRLRNFSWLYLKNSCLVSMYVSDLAVWQWWGWTGKKYIFWKRKYLFCPHNKMAFWNSMFLKSFSSNCLLHLCPFLETFRSNLAHMLRKRVCYYLESIDLYKAWLRLSPFWVTLYSSSALVTHYSYQCLCFPFFNMLC